MQCPRCVDNGENGSRTEVRETRSERSIRPGVAVRRRRRCRACGYRFTTVEQPKAAPICGEEGEIEAFDEARLLRSLERANADAALDANDLRAVAESVRWFVESHRGSVASRSLAEITLAQLLAFSVDAHDLYRERTTSLAGEKDPANGVIAKRWRHSESDPLGEHALEPFDRSKLLRSLKLAVHRRLREEALLDIVNTIERRVAATDVPVPTRQIHDWAADELRSLDSLAYLRLVLTSPDADMDLLNRTVKEIQCGLVRKQGKFPSEGLFSRDRLIASIRRSAAGREAISDRAIEAFASRIGDAVREAREPVESDQIGRWVLSWLRQQDRDAYVAYLFAVQEFSTADAVLGAINKKWDRLPEPRS